MLLNRVSPVDLLNEMQRSFSLIDELSGASRPSYSRNTYPPLNGWSDDENFYIEAELPGFSAAALNLALTENQLLTIQGQRQMDENAGQRNWVRRERGFGSFERQIRLPGPVQDDRVEASFKDGVLLIRLPKAIESRPRRIEVAKG